MSAAEQPPEESSATTTTKEGLEGHYYGDNVVIEVEWHKVGDAQSATVKVTGEHPSLAQLVQRLVDLVTA